MTLLGIVVSSLMHVGCGRVRDVKGLHGIPSDMRAWRFYSWGSPCHLVEHD